MQTDGKSLVRTSRWLALAGFGTLVGGIALGIRFQVGLLQTAGLVIGLALLVVGAIVGQIGRAKQGRVI